MGIALCMFFYDYRMYYHRGVTCKDKSYKLVFDEMDKHARRIALAMIMYIMTTYILMVVITETFIDCAVKGCLLCAIVIPIVNSHYSNPDKYDFRL